MVQKTTAQKRGDDVRAVADKLKKVRLKLQNKKVPDTIHLSEVFVRVKNKEGKYVLQVDKSKLKRWADEVAKQTGKISGVGGLWLLEYLTRGLNVVLVDNAVIRNMEDASKKNALTKFGKKQPWLKNYLLYYMAVGTMAVSGVQLAANGFSKDDDKEDDKKKNEVVIDDDNNNENVLNTINPNDADFVQKAVNEYWDHVAVGLTELETYREVSKRHGGEERETNGLGCTWYYIYDNNGVLHRHPNKIGETKRWVTGYNYDQARRHLIYETLPALQKAIKDKNNMTARVQIALIMAGYQRPADMKYIADKISKAKTDQEIADAFMVYNGASKWKIGTWKRRWWCAAYAIGAITTEDFLNLSRDAFSSININRVMQNGHFMISDEAVKYALTVAKSGYKSTVKSFLNSFEEGRQILKSVSGNKSRTISFNDAVKQIRKQNARGDLLLYGHERQVDKA